MDRPRENREIDISRARPRNRETRRAPAAASCAAGASHAVASARLRTAAAQVGGEAAAPEADRHGVNAAPAAKRRRRKGGHTAAIVAACVLLVIALFAGGAYLYVDSLIQESDLGSFDDVQPLDADSGSTQQSIVPPDFKGVRNILVLGLDYDDDDAVERDKEHPNTDMILYVRLDGNEHTLMMLQFPRDIFVGQAGGAAGKINGILAANVDAGNGLGAMKT